MRQPGYYWVKYEGEWKIAEWTTYHIKFYKWRLGTYIRLHRMKDSDFEEIDERRIERTVDSADKPHWKQTTKEVLDAVQADLDKHFGNKPIG